MKPLTLAALLCAFVAVVGLPLTARGQGMAASGERPLDLRIPSQSLSRVGGSSAGGVVAQLPNLGGAPDPGPSPKGFDQSDGSPRALPYGAGYEMVRYQSLALVTALFPSIQVGVQR